MNEQDKNQSTKNIDDNDDVFGNDEELDLGSETTLEFDPFSDTSFVDEEIPTEQPKKETVEPSNPDTNVNSVKKETNTANPLEKALDAVETKEAVEARKSILGKPPVFDYAGATEDVEDTSKTFEDLRIEKGADFPELDDGKRVSWTVEYGKITKNVADPKKMTIGKMKTDIEASKEFLDALKKTKDKEPVCKLKPKVTAQTKGKMSAYKGVFTTMEDAINSGKVITILPSNDGKVYEMRQNEMGRFITPVIKSDMLSEVRAGFSPALPTIPYEHLLRIIGFFRAMAHKGNYEALVNIYWDKQEMIYITDVPKQTVTPVSVNSNQNPEYDNDRYIHYMDVHSHNRMKAFFSPTDNNDEKATRVYAVIGNVLDYFPEIKVRISNGGTFLEIEPNVVFEDFDFFKHLFLSWLEQVEIKNAPKDKKAERVFNELLKSFDGGDDE